MASRAAGAGGGAGGHGAADRRSRRPRPPRHRAPAAPPRPATPWGRPLGTTPVPEGSRGTPPPRGEARRPTPRLPGPRPRDSAVAGRRPPSTSTSPTLMRGRGPLVSQRSPEARPQPPAGQSRRGAGKGHSLSRRGKPPTAPRLGARGDWSPRRGSASRPLPHPPRSTHGSLLPERRKHVRV